MKKKGFTLIELLISIVLVSIVLVSLTSTLVGLKNSYNETESTNDIIIYSSSISRILNNDFVKNNGIRNMVCNVTGTKCDLVFGNNQKRRIEIIETEIEEENEKTNTTIKNLKST